MFGHSADGSKGVGRNDRARRLVACPEGSTGFASVLLGQLPQAAMYSWVEISAEADNRVLELPWPRSAHAHDVCVCWRRQRGCKVRGSTEKQGSRLGRHGMGARRQARVAGEEPLRAAAVPN